MNQTLTDFKKFIVSQCKKKSACEYEFKRIVASETFEDILQVLKDYYHWCFENALFTKEDIIQLVPTQDLLDNGFYYDYSGELLNDKVAVVYDSNIFNVRDNAIVQDVRGNATVQNVRGNATVQNVRGNATVQNVRGNAVVQNVWDNATYRIIRFGEKPKLFMKKDTYTIVEL